MKANIRWSSVVAECASLCIRECLLMPLSWNAKIVFRTCLPPDTAIIGNTTSSSSRGTSSSQKLNFDFKCSIHRKWWLIRTSEILMDFAWKYMCTWNDACRTGTGWQKRQILHSICSTAIRPHGMVYLCSLATAENLYIFMQHLKMENVVLEY